MKSRNITKKEEETKEKIQRGKRERERKARGKPDNAKQFSLSLPSQKKRKNGRKKEQNDERNDMSPQNK